MNGNRLAILPIVLAFSIAFCHRSPTSEREPADPAAVARGRQLFLDHCAICHGVRGDGHGARGAAFDPRPPDFTNAEWQATHSIESVTSAIRDGKRGTAMPSWRALPEQERRDLAAFVKSLS